MSFKPYPKYKESGVEWLGRVPEHWGVKRLKHMAARIPYAIVDGPFGTQLKAEDYRSSGVPLVRISNLSFTGKFLEEDLVFIEDSKAEEVSRSTVRRGDVVIGKTGATIGKSALFNYSDKGVIASSCLKITPETDAVSSAFLGRIIESDGFQKTLLNESGGSTRDTINITPFGNLSAVLPPMAEQLRVCRFLDHETAKIDALIAEQQRLIELLQEKRQAVISQAVTKGLNPDAPMKDSGIEWLGEVPEHWEVWKVSQAFSQIGSGTTPKSDQREYYDDGDVPWVNTGDLNDSTLLDCPKRVTAKAMADHTSLRVYPPGSLLFAMYGATIGKLGLLGFPATVNQACCVLVEGKAIDPLFMFYWFLGLRTHVLSLATGGGQPNVSQDIVRSLRVACPGRAEQKLIVDYLTGQSERIDRLVTESLKAISLLQERRSALISAAVTGQIDVRGFSTGGGSEAA